jgi:hypothetical protein
MNEPLRVKKIGVIIPVLAISGLLGASLSVPRLARAANTGQILETMGISIAVGTVLGASTLPFYDQPGTHLINLGYGAAAGAVTGLGVLVYQWIAGPGQDEYAKAGKQFPLARRLVATGPAILANDYVAPRSKPTYPTQFWTPVVSLNW